MGIPPTGYRNLAAKHGKQTAQFYVFDDGHDAPSRIVPLLFFHFQIPNPDNRVASVCLPERENRIDH